MIERVSTLREVAFEVCTALDEAGVVAVLSGGGAASIHAPEAIQSFDLDFILTAYTDTAPAEQALEQLGFGREGQDYRHVLSPFQLEFPPGPLAVGDDLITTWDTLHAAGKLLHVITPTDSCRDRLAAFYHFKDRSSLDQALAVHAHTKDRIDLESIRTWSAREGHAQAFEEFVTRATAQESD